MTVHVENFNESIQKKSLELINDFSKVTVYKINMMQKSNVSLVTARTAQTSKLKVKCYLQLKTNKPGGGGGGRQSKTRQNIYRTCTLSLAVLVPVLGFQPHPSFIKHKSDRKAVCGE